MLNSEPIPGAGPEDAAVERIVGAGAIGAIVLAGLATAIVVALWVAFYLLVFVPRAAAP